MQLLTSAPATLSQAVVSTVSPVPTSLLSAPTPQRSKLKMVWHKEFDGQRERMVAQWVID